ncbi:MAG TPA: ankyrin repeat domain-containing protein, partial [Pirellulaceae bacterium]|nr:ankyrin repeat domain-containing protein [Pirellulaceae bacterium]
MKLGCTVSLLLFGAFVYGYYVWLGQTFDSSSREVWIASFVAGLIATGGIGALMNSYYAWRDGSVLSDALVDMPRRDGRRTAAAGTLEPLGEPLVAPLSGKACVLYEYDIYRNVTRSKKGGGTETNKSVDFAGLGKAECIIRSTSSKLRLIGFPDLEPVADEHFSDQADVERARQYVQFTAWDDASGLGILQGAHGMWSALTGSEESLRKDWRMIGVKECPWLGPAPQQPAAESYPDAAVETSSALDAEDHEPEPLDEDFDDEEELDDDDDVESTWQDGSGYHPLLAEKRIEPGQQVVAIGRYDEVRQGLVSGGTQTIKIYLDDVQSVARKLASAKWSYLFGGILTLVLVNAGVGGAQQIYRRSDTAQRKWRGELEQAIRQGDAAAIQKLEQRGADLKALFAAGRQPVLMSVRDPAMAKLLIERGADVNAADEDGTTPLMQAVRSKNPALVKLLIEAKADL